MSIFSGIGLEPGDEVITVSHTFAATANAILYTGATPVFIDIEPDTYLIDAKQIEAAITPRTRAICPVHLFGLVADMDMIQGDRRPPRARRRRGRLPGPRRDVPRPQGGQLRPRRIQPLRDEEHDDGRGRLRHDQRRRLADWLRLYRNQGMRARYQFEMLGFNFRLTDLAAAIGLAQLAKLAAQHGPPPGDRGRATTTAFGELPIGLPITPDGRTHVFHQYTIDVGGARDAIVADLREAGVGADIYYPIPVHRQAYIMERGLHADLPVTDAAAARTLALPMFPGLTDAEQDAGDRRASGRPSGATSAPARRAARPRSQHPTPVSPPDDRSLAPGR